MSQATPSDVRVHLELTLEQAAALVQAADLYSRVCIVQIEEIERLIREGRIPHAAYDTPGGERATATPEQCEQVQDRGEEARSDPARDRRAVLPDPQHHPVSIELPSGIPRVWCRRRMCGPAAGTIPRNFDQHRDGQHWPHSPAACTRPAR